MYGLQSDKLPGWENLAYFRCGEWQVVEERLHESGQYNPARRHLFSALVQCPFESVRVCILGQDPYPKRMHCTGIAFSIPAVLGVKDYPPTLVNIFKEYQDDLHYPAPKNGDLTKWVKQGVLLWNVYPSCHIGKPGSHHWDEWTYLTREIVEKLDGRERPPVFVSLGAVAHSFGHTVSNGAYIRTSHPSPLGANKGFLGSRLFSSINAKLDKTINWRLDDVSRTDDTGSTSRKVCLQETVSEAARAST